MAVSTQIGVLDTSVIIDLDHLTAASLPAIATVPSIVLAELGAGIHAATDPIERAHRSTGCNESACSSNPCLLMKPPRSNTRYLSPMS